MTAVASEFGFWEVMRISAPTLEQWLDGLRQNSFRVTDPRRVVMQRVLGQTLPFTAEELYAELKSQGIGRATVFRTLKILHELDYVVRVHLEEGCQHYQLAPGGMADDHHHDRIICRYCGDVSYLDECPIKDHVDDIVKRSGYRMQGHHLDLYGVCTSCDR